MNQVSGNLIYNSGVEGYNNVALYASSGTDVANNVCDSCIVLVLSDVC